MEKMSGHINISRLSGDIPKKAEIDISIEDSNSGVTFFSGSLSLEDFARLITGQGYIDIQYNLRNLDKVGKIHEHKVEVISLDNYLSNMTDETSDEIIASILVPYEVDGWVARKDDFYNYHNITRDGKSWKYKVIFDRFVEVKDA